MILGEEIFRVFGARVEAARKKKGLTQEELAERIGVSQSMINHIEKARKKPSFENAIAIAREFNTTVESLLAGV